MALIRGPRGRPEFFSNYKPIIFKPMWGIRNLTMNRCSVKTLEGLSRALKEADKGRHQSFHGKTYHIGNKKKQHQRFGIN